MTEKAEESIRVHLLAASECLARCCPTSETVNAGWQRALGRHWQILLDVKVVVSEGQVRHGGNVEPIGEPVVAKVVAKSPNKERRKNEKHLPNRR